MGVGEDNTVETCVRQLRVVHGIKVDERVGDFVGHSETSSAPAVAHGQVTYTRATGRKANAQDAAFWCLRMVTDTRAAGRTASSTDTVLLLLRTAISAKEIGARADLWEWEKAGNTDNPKNATRMDTQSFL